MHQATNTTPPAAKTAAIAHRAPPPLTAKTILGHIADAAEFQRQRVTEPGAFEGYLHAALRAYAPHDVYAHWAWVAMDAMREPGLMPQQPRSNA